MKIVICGGGIIGSSTAYYLAKRNQSCTIVERCGIACAASGKAGGFLTNDWSDWGALRPLARCSFDLHMELANELKDYDCGYRRVDTLSVGVSEGGPRTKSSMPTLPDWVDGSVSHVSVLGSTDTTAQVTPYKLTSAFVNEATRLVDTTVKIGVVTEIIVIENKVRGVRIGDETIPADVVVIAMGPWSGQATKWLATPMIYGYPNDSIVMQPSSTASITAHAIFTDIKPEIYPRPDGTVYMCGPGEKPALPPVFPDDPSMIKSTEHTKNTLHKLAGAISSSLATAEVIESNCCYMPYSPDGLPVIGRVPNVEGAYIATGHFCWGILTAPATGTCLAELILTGKCTQLDLSAFDPGRFASKR